MKRTYFLMLRRLILAFSFVAFCGVLYADEPSAKSFTFRAIWFDEGNMTSTTNYGTNPALVNNNVYPNQATFKILFPESGRYAVSVLYAAQQARPVELSFDGTKIGEFGAQLTGSWSTSSAKWERVAEFDATQGEHTLHIERAECSPHIVAFKLEPLFAMQADWTPRKVALEGTNDREEQTPWVRSNVGGWYYEVAEYSSKRKESGETFLGHFGGETIVALAPEAEIELTIPDVKETSSAFNINDETTYFPGMLAKNADDAEKPVEFVVRATRKIDENSANPQFFAAPIDFTLNLERYRLLIDKTQKLFARLTEEFGEAEIEELYGSPLNELTQTLTERADALDAWNAKLQTSENASETKLQFAVEFFNTIRLYARLMRSNPLVDFDDLLFVRRNASNNGLPVNWASNSSLNAKAFDDSLWALKTRPEVGSTLLQEKEIFRPKNPAFIGDVDLHFDADRFLFSSTNETGQWNVFESTLDVDDSGVISVGAPQEKLPRISDANAYDACYAPDDSIIYTSSACFVAVPCVNGSTRVTNTYRQYNDEAKTIRRLTFDQEHNWSPVMTEDGRVMYQRWEYADVPHAHARLTFLMNPDGTNQQSFYGTNSYWPNSMFYARPVPGEPSKFFAIVTGHHGVARQGELVLFDVSKGRKEASGAVQRFCAKDHIVASKTDPKYYDSLIVDCLAAETYPRFLHPYPLSAEYCLVSACLSPDDNWGVYLVDSDDNMLLLAKEKGFSCFEPVPLRETERPPLIADRVDTSKEEATVFIADIYEGDGLKNVPRGTVKNLRLFTYNFLFPNMGGPEGCVGAEGPWDIRNTLGIVPVEPNGSASFKVPANMPIALQPLDENGKALQLMRSWFTAMPGETLSCIGCHEDQNSVSSSSLDPTEVQRLKPKEIQYWRGPTRGYSFTEEVQPVLDRYCVSCHDGSDKPLASFDLRGLDKISGYKSCFHMATNSGNWSTSYNMLHRFVRRPGIESDYHLLMPMEFSADATDLYQMLLKGHYGVKLDAESWDRIITWIDLNAPYHGYWHEQGDPNNAAKWNKKRVDIMKLYDSGDLDLEEKKSTNWDSERAAATFKTFYSSIPENPLANDAQNAWRLALAKGEPLADGTAAREEALKREKPLPVDFDWTFDSDEAKKRQADEAERLFGDRTKTTKTVEIAPGVALEFQLIPAGKFVMGAQTVDEDGRVAQRYDDEQACVVEIEKPFWISAKEITNEQFELFDPSHDSGVESRFAFQFGVRGFYVNSPDRAVVRVSWNAAEAFCAWLSEEKGARFGLPTEAQWEYACRAGTSTSFFYGGLDDDFGQFANLADVSLRKMICHPYFKEIKPLNGSEYDYWTPSDERFNDDVIFSDAPGKFKPNAWGLYDMHGNAAEWTASLARPYPYDDKDGRNDLDSEGLRVARGGSWRDRPINARSEFRSFYRPWQGVYNVGFRVTCEID